MLDGRVLCTKLSLVTLRKLCTCSSKFLNNILSRNIWCGIMDVIQDNVYGTVQYPINVGHWVALLNSVLIVLMLNSCKIRAYFKPSLALSLANGIIICSKVIGISKTLYFIS